MRANEYNKNHARLNKPTLILGETGTGKSVLAKKIHSECMGSRDKFIQLNITSLNHNLFESELFGHEKGAFSGAINQKNGFCTEVGTGTLFIDELGDLSLELQSKLLTLIDERTFYRVGSCIEQTFKGRLIFATNKDIKKMVAQEKFREDLYYRLRFFQVDLPPLRESGNIFQLILEMINSTRVKFSSQRTNFSNEIMTRLCEYSWPGNYRELSNTIEYLFSLNKARLDIFDIPIWILESKKRQNILAEEGSYQLALEGFQKRYFESLLRKNGGMVNKSAQVSGISKVTLISKLKKYGIDRRVYKNLEKVERLHGF